MTIFRQYHPFLMMKIPLIFWEDLCLENSMHIPTDNIDQDNTFDSFIYLNDDLLTNEELRAKQRAAVRTTSTTQTYREEQSPACTSTTNSSVMPGPGILQSHNKASLSPNITNDFSSNEQPINPVEPPTKESVLREDAAVPIQPDIISNNPLEDTSQDPTLSPNITTHDTIRCSTRTTKGQFTSTRYEDEFHFTSVSGTGSSPSQQEQLVNSPLFNTLPKNMAP